MALFTTEGGQLPFGGRGDFPPDVAAEQVPDSLPFT